jgi:hypothetical protein
MNGPIPHVPLIINIEINTYLMTLVLVIAVLCDLPGQNSDWFQEQPHRGATPPLG